MSLLINRRGALGGLLGVAGAGLSAGCTASTSHPQGDDGASSSGTRDGGFVDGGTRDGGFVDGGTRDGGFVDGGTRDGGFETGAIRTKIMRPEADIGLVPSNPDAVLAFYRDVMGFVEQPSATFNEVVQYRFAVGKHLLKVNRIPALPAPQRGGFELAIGMRMLRFLLDDLDAVLARLDAADHEYTSIDVPEASDFRLVRTRDPEGNVFELVGLNTPGGEALTSRVEIGFTVSDLARSRKWYGEVLGLPEQQPITIDADIGVRYGFTWGATTLQMWQMPGRLPVETGNAFERAGIRYLTVLCDDIVAAQAEIIRRGIPIVQPLNELPGAVAKVFIFKDPDGNWLEYAQKA